MPKLLLYPIELALTIGCKYSLSGNKIQFKHNTKSKNLEFDNVYDIDSSLSIFLYLLYTFYIINIVKL